MAVLEEEPLLTAIMAMPLLWGKHGGKRYGDEELCKLTADGVPDEPQVNGRLVGSG